MRPVALKPLLSASLLRPDANVLNAGGKIDLKLKASAP